MDDVLFRLQQWYARHCDGDWEHDSGIQIDTLDNPGWIIKINLAGTELEGRSVQPITHGLGDDASIDWHSLSLKGNTFEAAGDPSKLMLLLKTFLDWAEESRCETG
jgi:hypothetical protein